MSVDTGLFTASWKEDCTNAIEARLAAPGASGAETGDVAGIRWIQQGDISSIVVKVFDRNGATPDTPLSASPTVDVEDVVFDTPFSWRADRIGGNLRINIPPACFPTGGHYIDVEVTTTLIDGFVDTFCVSGRTTAFRGS